MSRNGRPLCKISGAQATMVDELIDTDRMCWSEEKLVENFIHMDRDAILQIPLGRFADDGWAWTQEKSSIFFGTVCLPSDIISSACDSTIWFWGSKQFLLEKALEIIDSTESSIFLVASDQRICAV